MLSFTNNNDGTVTLKYESGEVLVRETDFNRAFGTMVNNTKEDIEEEFGIKEG